MLFLLKNKDKLMTPLSKAMESSGKIIKKCKKCGNLSMTEVCTICESPKRDRSIICCLEDVSDLWSMEKTGCYKGLYHVLGGNLSALDGIGPDELMIKELIERAKEETTKEIILALSSNVNGQTTLHYITDQLNGTKCKVTTLAQGMPFGAELNFVDEGTLTTAFKARKPV